MQYIVPSGVKAMVKGWKLLGHGQMVSNLRLSGFHLAMFNPVKLLLYCTE